ncbi:MAG: SRPBCC family protein [Bacteroidales bacterium]|nr:SRPBCC family protein [Bacteroidales bacterium]
MKFLSRILSAILVIIATLLVIAVFLPSKQTLVASIEINASSDKVFDQVNTLKNWSNWSPFQENDSSMTVSFEGNESGVGAIQKWSSPRGDKGIMEILISEKNNSIVNKIAFEGAGQATGEWIFNLNVDKTNVKWSLTLEDLSYPVGRFMGLFAEAMMQPVLMKGLKNLQSVCEKNSDDNKFGIIEVNVPTSMALVVTDSCYWDQIAPKMAEMFGMVYQTANQISAVPIGYPYAEYLVWDESKQFTVFKVGLPINEIPDFLSDNVMHSTTPGGRAIKGVHHGAYDKTYDLYIAMDKYISDHHLSQNGGPWENYVTNPVEEPDTSKWITEIFFPIK